MNMQTKIASPLSRTTVLASVKISLWTARKLDREITDETNRRHNASRDAGRYNKRLIEAERLSQLNALASQARHLHYTLTRPWQDEGARILPNVLYMQFVNQFRDLKREFNDAADKFCADYPAFIEERKEKLNGAFKASDYPSPDIIRSKFRLDYSIVQFPDVADFRADLDDDTVADIKAEMAATHERVVDDAMRDTASDIIKHVGHMATKLKEYKTNKPGERRFFLDSLVDNVRELAELLPAFNLTNDPRLDAITRRITTELCADDAQALRDNDTARESVAKSADDIVAEVSKFFA